MIGPDSSEGTFDPNQFAGSTIQEVALVIDALRSLAVRGRQPTQVHVIAGRKHLARVDDILNALDYPLADNFIGIVHEGEAEGVMADVTRWVYRAAVLRGARHSLSTEELVRRERATIGRAFGAVAAVKGMAMGLRSRSGRPRTLHEPR
jgi:hypothetical protein